jgi:hypothetical protein
LLDDRGSDANLTANEYTRLFSVTIHHNYYATPDGLCPDFRVGPTAATATLMASLGLALKNEGTGFSIFYPLGGLPGLLAYLQREAKEAGGGFWSRLTFLMELVNPRFVGITALPIATTQSSVNLYGCNSLAHGDPKKPVLPEGEYMGAESLYQTVGQEVNVELPPETDRVTVTDISGAVVIPPPDGKKIELFDAGGEKRALIDFGSLPHDLYTINALTGSGLPVPGPGYPWTILYVPSGSATMGLIDMLFTRPTPDMKGIYPIPSPLGAPPKAKDCGGIAYRLPFDARRTYWQYYVVSQVAGKLVDLRIEGADATFREHPHSVKLPDGSMARQFTADTALPLREKSAQRFRLSGRRRDLGGQDNAILKTRLPVAPAAPVWPAAESTAGTSEMFIYV